MAKLSVAHIVASLHPNAGGPSRTVVELTDGLARLGIDVGLICQGRAREPTVMSSEVTVDRHVVGSPSAFAMQLGLPVRQLLQRLAANNRPMLMHSHGLWLAVNHWTSLYAQRLDIPLIIHPRGMLEPWALSSKAWKKRIALALYQRRELEIAKLFIATAPMEMESIRALGLRQPIAVIPNGVRLNRASLPDVNAHVLHSKSAERSVLFLSRLHPKKGILSLLHAWALLAPKGWRLKIAGPDEGGHLSEVTALASRLGINRDVEYLGEVVGDAKSRAYLEANLFVLPTFSENFGVVVAEALAHGLPVITTRGAPWSDLEEFGCGWWVDIGVDPLVDALRNAMSLNDDERKAMGARGQVYAQRYDWTDIAEQTADVYRWMLGQGSKPDCVNLD